VIAIIVGALFGGADQYLGSIASLPWASSISLLSAPWLILPFCFGSTQRDPSRAIAMGLVATYAALVGYGIMTLSPMEGVHLSHNSGAVAALIQSESKVIIGGLVTGPLFGFLGQQWRSRRAWTSAALVTGALCLEPLVRELAGSLSSPSSVWMGEIVVGVVLAAYFAAEIVRRSSHC
jgi:hypothetical protein